ncbi:MAG: outer membrane beta-barrel protein [Acidobacteriota bacterium]|nr:outer membrane beta-barrel protein [Acidobacteriota bacterium]
MKIKPLIIALLTLSVMAYAQEEKQKFSFSIRGSYFIPLSSTFNNQLRPATNENLHALVTYLKDFGLTSFYNEMGKMNGAINIGGEFEVRATEQFSLAFGVDYAFKTLSTSVNSGGTVDSISYSVNETGEVGLSVLPITATFRINLPFSKIRAHIGGGLGYYLARYTEKESWQWIEDEESIDSGTRKTVATGNAFLPHAEAGAEYKLSRKISLAAIIRYPFGTIGSFKIKEASDDPAAVGQKLTFIDADGIQRDFKWELSGPLIGVNLKFRF